MKVVFLTIAGAVLGVLSVRAFFLTMPQEIGWCIFWKNLFNSNSTISLSLVDAIHSQTFVKCLAGFLIGGIGGFLLGIFLRQRED